MTREPLGRAPLRAWLQHVEVQDPRVAGLPAPSRKQAEGTSRYGRLAAVLDTQIAGVPGWLRQEFAPFLGTALAGLLSGTFTTSTSKGLQVSSFNRPEGWKTYGDKKLVESPGELEEASRAVVEAREQLLLTRRTGVAMHRGDLMVASALPAVI